MKNLFLAAFLCAVFPAALDAQIILNEIMYYPDPNQPEWVELFNAGDQETEIQGWTIREDSNSSGSSRFSSVIPAGEYVVITGDVDKFTERWGEIPSPLIEASFSYLNNNGGDCVRLRDGDGAGVDEVCYRDTWGGRSGKSLERRSPDLPSDDSASWGTSVDTEKGTPGRVNSVLVSSASSPRDDEVGFHVVPNPAREYVRVLMPEKSSAGTRELQVIDVNGALVRTMSAMPGEAAIHLADLPSGFYILRLITGEDNSIERPFTLVR